MLGAYLNVPVRELKKIKSTHTHRMRCKLEMLHYWLYTTMTASIRDGGYLNVPVRKLKKINSTLTQDPMGWRGCKLEMLQYWLVTTMTASIRDIARALEQLNMLTV